MRNGKRQTFDAIITKDPDGYFSATVAQLRGCHTQAKTMDELSERLKEVIELCLEDEDLEIQDSEFIGIHRVSLEAA